MYVCPKCGAIIYGDAVFCGNCGGKLDASDWREADQLSDADFRSNNGHPGTASDDERMGPGEERTRQHAEMFGEDDSMYYTSREHLNDTADDLAGESFTAGSDEDSEQDQTPYQQEDISWSQARRQQTDPPQTGEEPHSGGGNNGGMNDGEGNDGEGNDGAPKKSGRKKIIGIIAVVLAALLVLGLMGSSCIGSKGASDDSDIVDTDDEENDTGSDDTGTDETGNDDTDTGDTDPDEDDTDTGEDDTDTGGDDSASGKTLLAEELSLDVSSGTTPDASSTSFQALDAYADTYLDYDGPSEDGTNIIYSMYGGSEAYDVIKEYIELLTDCMNFELVDSVELLYDSTYFSYALEYTGTATVDVKNSMNFADDVYGDVTFWGMIEDDDLEVHMTVPNVLSAEDLGWRYGGTADISPKGDSVTAGLYQLSDGSYETTDGRLTTTLGSADVIVEGTETEGDAVYVITTDAKEELFVGGYYDEEEVYFTTGYENVKTGDLYTLENLRWDNASMQKYDDPSAFILGTCFTIYHNGTWTYPLYSDDSMYNELSLRVMYYEEDAVAVFYIYAELTTSPAAIELLAAVDLSDAVADSDDSSGSGSGSINYDDDDDDESVLDCVFCDGTGECSNCGGDGYVYSYALGERDKVNCSKCSATGKCWYCSGTGKR